MVSNPVCSAPRRSALRAHVPHSLLYAQCSSRYAPRSNVRTFGHLALGARHSGSALGMTWTVEARSTATRYASERE